MLLRRGEDVPSQSCTPHSSLPGHAATSHHWARACHCQLRFKRRLHLGRIGGSALGPFPPFRENERQVRNAPPDPRPLSPSGPSVDVQKTTKLDVPPAPHTAIVYQPLGAPSNLAHRLFTFHRALNGVPGSYSQTSQISFHLRSRRCNPLLLVHELLRLPSQRDGAASAPAAVDSSMLQVRARLASLLGWSVLPNSGLRD